MIVFSILIEELEQKEEFKTGVKLIKESKEGPPADVILKTAEDENIDLIVIWALQVNMV